MKTLELIEDFRNYYVISEVIDGGPVINRVKANGPFKEAQVIYIVK